MTTLERWQALYDLLNDRPHIGAPGVRDPANPCDHFAPKQRDCLGDGHYLCDECERLKTCARCGQREYRCECVD